jgi:endonuclease YncB( thermonuclease family)
MRLPLHAAQRLLLLAALAAASAAPARADIIGPATVIDGDTISVAGREVRIFGIDAPEQGQTCTYPDGESWPCGGEASAMMFHLVVNQTIYCEQRGVDAHGRAAAICDAGGSDLGRAMVDRGLALAWRPHGEIYFAAEAEAKKARRGMWNGTFVKPREWRDSH